MGPYWSIEFLYGKSAFSNKLYEEIQRECTQNELINGDLSTECQATVDKINAEVGGYWAYAYYDDCWYENDIRRRSLKALQASFTSSASATSSGEKKYFGPPIVSSASVSVSVRGGGQGLSAAERVLDVPNGYACGGPAAQVRYGIVMC